MLDSGAFSAWRKGEEIDVKAYMAFIREYRDLIYTYVSLDTIPGSMGRMDRSQTSIEKSAAASYKNQQIMRDAGLTPIPVFHQGERFEWLEKYLSDGEPYIGISPYLRSTQSNLMKWMDECFTRVTDSSGRALAKTHGFGVTSHEAIWRYPWQSVDSTTWAIAPCYGMLVMPSLGASGKFDVREPAKQFYVGGGIKPPSENIAASFTSGGDMYDWAAGRRIDDLGEIGLDWLHKFAEICGTSVTAFRNDQYARTAAHIMYFKLLGDERKEVRFKHPRASFVGGASGRARAAGPPADIKFRVVFATNTTYKQGRILTRFGVFDRLLSYWNLRDVKTLRGRLERYVEKGYQGERDDIAEVGGEIMDEEPAVRVNWGTMNYTDFRRRRLVGRFAGEGQEDGQEAAP